MSLDKAIRYGKEYRREYRGAKAVDPTCRNHGGCPYCAGNRTYEARKGEETSKYKIENDVEGEAQR